MIRITRSLFRNIVLWYTLCVTVLAIVFSTVFYAEIERGRRKPFDVRLVTQSRFLAERLRNTRDLIDLTFLLPGEISNNYFAIYEHTWQSSLIKSIPWWQVQWKTNYVNFNKLYECVARNQPYFGQKVGYSGQQYRFTIIRANIKALDASLLKFNEASVPRDVYIIYADVYERYDQYLGIRKYRLVLTTMGFLILIFVSGIIVARLGVRPIQRLAVASRAITPEDPKTRLPVATLPDELGYLAEQLNQAFDRLDTALQSERTFTGAAAHELRSPVAGIAGRLDTLRRREDLQPELKEQIEHLYKDAQRLARLSGRLLLLARLDRAAAGEDYPTSRVDLAEITEDAIEFCSVNAEQHGIRFLFEQRGDTTLDGHEEWLLRAVHNILNNAIKYSPDNGLIIVKVNAPVPGSYVKVEVTDQGPGIPEPDRAHVCERFYRGKKPGKADGTGLGLSIVTDVVRAHKGHISIDEGPNGIGTMVTMVVPRERKKRG